MSMNYTTCSIPPPQGFEPRTLAPNRGTVKAPTHRSNCTAELFKRSFVTDARHLHNIYCYLHVLTMTEDLSITIFT